MGLTAEIDDGDLLAFVAHLVRNLQPGGEVLHLLLRCQVLAAGAAGGRGRAARQLGIAVLGIGVAHAVELTEARVGRVALVESWGSRRNGRKIYCVLLTVVFAAPRAQVIKKGIGNPPDYGLKNQRPFLAEMLII